MGEQEQDAETILEALDADIPQTTPQQQRHLSELRVRDLQPSLTPRLSSAYSDILGADVLAGGSFVMMQGLAEAAAGLAGGADLVKMSGGIHASLAAATAGLGQDVLSGGSFAMMQGLAEAAAGLAGGADLVKMSGGIHASLAAATAGLGQDMTVYGAALSSRHFLDGIGPLMPDGHSLRPIYSELLDKGSLQVLLASKLQRTDVYDRQFDLNAAPLRHWRDLLTTPDGRDAAQKLRASETTLDTNIGLLGGELLLSAESENDAVTFVSEEVVQPWEAARDEARRQLHRKLELLDPAVPMIIDGAWHDVSLKGPAATMKIANAVVEMLDRSLRAAAPEDVVLSWHGASGRPARELNDGRPTRTVRYQYIASRAGLPAPLVNSQAASLSALMKEAQKAKHSAAVDHVTAQVLLVTAESLLTSLFCGTLEPHV